MIVLAALCLGLFALPAAFADHPADSANQQGGGAHDVPDDYSGDPGHAVIDPSLSLSGSGITVAGNVPLSALTELPPLTGNDIWGFTSQTGREYAILGTSHSTAFIEVTDPANPVVLYEHPGSVSTWRDMETFQQFAYSVNENNFVFRAPEQGRSGPSARAGGSGGGSGTGRHPGDGDAGAGSTGLQVFDLRQIDDGIVTHVRDYKGHDANIHFHTAHNVRVNEETARLYAVGSNNGRGGITIFDLTEPGAPFYVGRWNARYVHDLYVEVRDTGKYAGRELGYAACGGLGLWIVDLTDPVDPPAIGFSKYEGVGYCHHSWLDEERQLLYVNDELDEFFGTAPTTRGFVFDVSDPENPFVIKTFTNGAGTIDHNTMARDGYLFCANYTSGLRVFSIDDTDNIFEAGFFDTHPESDNIAFDGLWGVYSRLPSGRILGSDIQRGLFIFDVSGVVPDPEVSASADWIMLK